MKPIDGYTHYEILEVAANASSHDIQDAYKQVLSIYDTNSLSTYSLFTPVERAQLLAQVESAFQTLNDVEKRKAYDRSLLTSG